MKAQLFFFFLGWGGRGKFITAEGEKLEKTAWEFSANLMKRSTDEDCAAGDVGAKSHPR